MLFGFLTHVANIFTENITEFCQLYFNVLTDDSEFARQ